MIDPAAGRAEVVLHVDDQQRRPFEIDRHLLRRRRDAQRAAAAAAATDMSTCSRLATQCRARAGPRRPGAGGCATVVVGQSGGGVLHDGLSSAGSRQQRGGRLDGGAQQGAVVAGGRDHRHPERARLELGDRQGDLASARQTGQRTQHQGAAGQRVGGRIGQAPRRRRLPPSLGQSSQRARRQRLASAAASAARATSARATSPGVTARARATRPAIKRPELRPVARDEGPVQGGQLRVLEREVGREPGVRGRAARLDVDRFQRTAKSLGQPQSRPPRTRARASGSRNARQRRCHQETARRAGGAPAPVGGQQHVADAAPASRASRANQPTVSNRGASGQTPSRRDRAVAGAEAEQPAVAGRHAHRPAGVGAEREVATARRRRPPPIPTRIRPARDRGSGCSSGVP